MTKINWAIALAGIFITAVMIFLFFQGVHLKERRMIKWSTVESPRLAGEKVARFLFPISKEFGTISLRGDSSFAEQFFQGFKAEGLKNFSEAKFRLNPEDLTESGFSIQLQDINSDFVKGCKAGDSSLCVSQKAKKKFHKKDRDAEALWINMYRLSKNKSLLLFQVPVSQR